MPPSKGAAAPCMDMPHFFKEKLYLNPGILMLKMGRRFNRRNRTAENMLNKCRTGEWDAF